ncbi:hypothetical protein FNF29_02764 [Cafeteria roenbergensis]|nr:hypothetical protein FNF29_02764 [Cafeteria roenbergensis]|eukprot:KAA0154144.1 hypothetical protein FNF29_02764 [Cafeteria roenbergensis]
MNFDWKDVFKGTPVLDERVLEHLRTTYVLLAVTAATASAGCAAAIFIPGMLWLMSGFIGRILCFAATSFLGAAVANSTGSAKIGMLMAFGGAVGASLAPLISLAADVDPALVLSAALVTVAIFGTFTFIAMLTSDRPMLYLGGMLMSALGWMFFAGMINTLLGARTLFMTVELFFGLFIFCGFVIFDTQVLLARADEKLAAGGRLTTDDAATAAVRLFLDAVNIFVRVLIILIRNSQKKERKERK